MTIEGRLDVPEERNARTEAKWKARLASLLRYIDDGFTLTRINFENSFGFRVNGVLFRVKHAIQAQNVFRHLVRACLLYTSPSPRDRQKSRMPSSA